MAFEVPGNRRDDDGWSYCGDGLVGFDDTFVVIDGFAWSPVPVDPGTDPI